MERALILLFFCTTLLWGISNKGFTQKDTILANQYMDIADSLSNQMQKDQAIEFTLKARDLYQAAQAWPAYISCYNLLARYYDDKSETKTSFDLLQQAEILAKRHLPSNKAILANTFQLKGELFVQQDQQDSALVYLSKANNNFLQAEDMEGVAWANILMVVSYYYQMNYPAMDSLLNAVYELDERVHFPADTEIRETVFQWQQILYDETGEYEKSFKVSKQTLEERLLILNTAFDSSMLATNYANLGVIYKRKGDFDEAIRNLNLALDIQSGIQEDPALRYDIYTQLGLSYKDINEDQQALTYFKKGLKLLSKYPDQAQEKTYIKAYTAIGRSYIENQQLDSAIHYLNKAFRLSNKKNYLKDQVLLNLGLAYKEKSELDQAIAYFTEAVTINKSLYSNYSSTRLNLYQYLGEVYILKNDAKTALDFFQKGMQLLDKDFDGSDYFTNPPLQNIADKIRFLGLLQKKGTPLLAIHQNKSQLEKIHQSFLTASDLMDAIRRDYESENAKNLLSEQGHSIYETGIKVALMLYDSTSNKDYLNIAFDYAEKSKGLLLLESLHKIKSTVNNDNPELDTLLNEVKRLKLDIVFYERKLFEEAQKSKVNNLKYENWKAELSKLKAEYESQRFRMEKTFPDYYNLNFTSATASVESIQKYLSQKPGAAFIEYFMGDSMLYTFAITNTGFQIFRQKRSIELDNAINALIVQQSFNPTSLSQDNAQTHFQDYTLNAFNLYQKIVVPALIDKKINRLIFIPDGNLSYLSFESLLVQKVATSRINYTANHLQYLLEDFQISYAYSGTLLLESLQAQQNNRLKSYGGFAPVFKHQRQIALDRACKEDQLGTLAHSEKSVQTALDVLGGQAFLHQEASKANFLNHAADFRVLHLSTHACVDDYDPMFNKIYFSDEELNTYELYQLRLNADLVVLSACETGVGQLVNGEGVFSLARGFKQAGCPSVITSLWNANDYSTTQIMIDFHKNLKAGQTKDEALRNAKLTYLNSVPSRLAPPYFWATFIGIGNMNAVEFNRSWNLSWFIIPGILMLLFLGHKIKSLLN